MSQRAHIWTTLAHIPQVLRGGGLPATTTAPELEPCGSPSTTSPKDKFFAWHAAEDDAEQRAIWSAHSSLLQPRRWGTGIHGSTAVRSHRRPERRVLQTGVSVKRHLSRIFPAHPRSLASVLVPRPAAHRCSASATPPFGSGFPNKNHAKEQSRFFFGASAESTSRPWERGTSRRFAQECPEGNPGQIQTGELTWHSTKTKSL